MHQRYLTKSNFKLSMQCKTKLFYADKPDYANKSMDDPFLLSLAEGGFQVGALAKCYFPGGHEIEVAGNQQALRLTEELMKQESLVLFEGAFLYKNLFVRTDILVKSGKCLELIEVKAKSYDQQKDELVNWKGQIIEKWREYLYDVAYQKHVLHMALPEYEISASLMLVDKTARCPVDGLNQKFRVTKSQNGRGKAITPRDLPPEYLEPSLLIKVNADLACEQIYQEEIDFCGEAIRFAEYTERIAAYFERDQKISSAPSSVCKGCEFRASGEELKAGLKCGFRECWQESLGWEDRDFDEQTVLDL